MEEEREWMSLALLSVSDSPVLCTWSKPQSYLHHCKPVAFVGLVLLCPLMKEKLVQEGMQQQPCLSGTSITRRQIKNQVW